jgi:hypothetical protein
VENSQLSSLFPSRAVAGYARRDETRPDLARDAASSRFVFFSSPFFFTLRVISFLSSRASDLANVDSSRRNTRHNGEKCHDNDNDMPIRLAKSRKEKSVVL